MALTSIVLKKPYIMENCVYQNHITLQLKFKKQLIYNYCVLIPWVL
jgi:hypothetical protein